MTAEPTAVPSPIATDPTTTLVVLITELRVEVRQALAQLKEHETDIATLREAHAGLDTRVTVLETRQTTDDKHENDRVSRKAVFWGAVVALASVAAVVASILISSRHGG